MRSGVQRMVHLASAAFLSCANHVNCVQHAGQLRCRERGRGDYQALAARGTCGTGRVALIGDTGPILEPGPPKELVEDIYIRGLALLPAIHRAPGARATWPQDGSRL